MDHHFNVEDAVKYGMEKAVILYNLRYWIIKNEANNKHKIDGKTWTYNSGRAFGILFPYLKQQKISRLLREMEAEGIIQSGNFNLKGYDRTKWYTVITPPIVQNVTMDSSKCNNGLLQSEQPIPDINSDINSDEYITEPPEAPQSPSPLKAQPKKKGDTRVSELITYYHNKYIEYAGTKPTVTGGWGKNLKLLLKNHNQDQIQHIIDFFFDYKGRTQYNFYTFFNKFDNLAPMALKTMPKEDRSATVLLPGDEGYEELKPKKYTGYQDVEGR